MTKKTIIGVVTVLDDYRAIFDLNKNLYNKICVEFNEFYIINLKNLIIFNKKSFNKKSKIVYKNVKVFEPKNSKHFISFFKNKKLIAFNGLGKNFNNFKIYYLLSKINLIQILLMNIGFLNNTIEISSNNFRSFVSSFFFKYKRKITQLIFRIFTILKIFPKIDFYFDASKKIVDNINGSFLKKFENRYPFISFSYFKNVIMINSRAYDEFIDIKKKSEKYIVFIDTYFDHPDRTHREGNINKDILSKYYIRLHKLLNTVSHIYKKKIVICIHPKNKGLLFKKYFSKSIIKRYETTKMINNSFIVLFHESSAALDALLLKKNIIILKSALLGEYLSKRTSLYSSLLGINSISLDNNYFINKNQLNLDLKLSKKKYQTYIKYYLNSDGKIPGYKKVIDIIKKNLNEF
jgi:hypothetical protein